MAKNFEFGDSKEESTNVEIHGMLCEIFPMKKGKGTSYFDGKMNDCTTTIASFYSADYIICDLVWQKGTYNLSTFQALRANSVLFWMVYGSDICTQDSIIIVE